MMSAAAVAPVSPRTNSTLGTSTAAARHAPAHQARLTACARLPCVWARRVLPTRSPARPCTWSGSCAPIACSVARHALAVGASPSRPVVISCWCLAGTSAELGRLPSAASQGASSVWNGRTSSGMVPSSTAPYASLAALSSAEPPRLRSTSPEVLHALRLLQPLPAPGVRAAAAAGPAAVHPCLPGQQLGSHQPRSRHVRRPDEPVTSGAAPLPEGSIACYAHCQVHPCAQRQGLQQRCASAARARRHASQRRDPA